MAAPVQIILDQDRFVEAREKAGGGPNKDFFANEDDGFRRHKEAILGQLKSVADTLSPGSTENIGILKIVLRRSAWAKSHRPDRALFKSNLTPVVGGGDLGEVLVEARPTALRHVQSVVESAEDKTRMKPIPGTGKPVPYPGRARSETGAIERIELYGPADRRRFSVGDAIDWLANPMTGGAYHVELFDIPLLYQSFEKGLQGLGHGLVAGRLTAPRRHGARISLRVEKSASPPALFLPRPVPVRGPERSVAPFDPSIDRHKKLLTFLDNHPLVRRIELPPIITRTIVEKTTPSRSSATAGRTRPEAITLPEAESTRAYPKMGIIDGGISSALDAWLVDRWDMLADEDKSPNHGTFIAGLAIAGNALNGGAVCPEPDGVALVDISVFPDEQRPVFEDYYPRGAEDFLDEVANAVSDASTRHSTRIYNLSLNAQHQAGPDRYGYLAARIDAIAEQNDAIFFISAGNTALQDTRSEWPAKEIDALTTLASAQNDGILIPAESIRSVSVAALNPPDLPNCISHAPARYSRRGPGLRAGVKPDLAHIGGSGSPQPPLGHGLFSVTPDGLVCDGCGTSYATPLVAKTAAMLDHIIEGGVSRETIIAMLLHHARMPEPLESKTLSGIARDLAGYGMPPSANDILEGSDHSITLVFAHRIPKDQQISFQFSWPPSLVKPGGKCRGEARLTLVSSPPFDPAYGAEFVRVNVEAALQQEDFDEKSGKPGWKGRLEAAYLPERGNGPIVEAERIRHGFKWSPTKMFSRQMRGLGKSSNWRMFVSYLTRAGETMSDEGVPFTAILTISDPAGAAPVFIEMRSQLARSGVRIEDIQIAARITTRV